MARYTRRIRRQLGLGQTELRLFDGITEADRVLSAVQICMAPMDKAYCRSHTNAKRSKTGAKCSDAGRMVVQLGLHGIKFRTLRRELGA